VWGQCVVRVQSRFIQSGREQPAKYPFVMSMDTNLDQIGLHMGAKVDCSIILVDIDKDPLRDAGLGYLCRERMEFFHV